MAEFYTDKAIFAVLSSTAVGHYVLYIKAAVGYCLR